MADKPFSAYEGDEPYFFVSYLHDEADLIYPEMVWIREAGFNLWYDEGIHVGSVWRQALADALADAAGLIFFATARSSESANCQRELNFILDEEKPIFVVQLDDTPLPNLLRLSLSDRQALVRSEFDEDTYHSRLVSALGNIVPLARMSSLSDSTGSAEIPTDPPSITIAAFSCHRDERDLTYLRDGVVSELVGRLSQYGWRVASDRQRDESTASATRYTVDGAIQRVGDRARLTVHLAEAPSGVELWTKRYEQSAEEIVKLQDQLVASTARDLFNAVLDAEERRLKEVPDDELDAWGLIARSGVAYVDRLLRGHRPGELRHMARIRSLLELAITRDPDFAYAHSLLGHWLSEMSIVSIREPEVQVDALALADRALKLAPNNATILTNASATYRICGDVDYALRLAETAAEISGHRSKQLMDALIAVGRFEDAVDLGNEYPDLGTGNFVIALTILGRFEQVIERTQRLKIAEPFSAFVFLANAQAQLGRMDEAKASFERVKEISPDWSVDRNENAQRIAWQNRKEIYGPLVEGLRKIEAHLQ